MKKSNWDTFPRELQSGQQCRMLYNGAHFLSFPLLRVSFALVFEVVVCCGGKRTGFGDIGNCSFSVKEM